MKMDKIPERRAFLFLQGPPGPMLYQLGQAMRPRGVSVHRINICAGDRLDWPEPATNYRGRFSDWATFIDQFLRKHRITDIMLFGDCRPYHVSARRIASLRGIRTHVLEEGYLRPHWMTLELEGVNAHSRLPRNKEWIYARASKLPPEPDLPPVTASFRRRVRDGARHYAANAFGRPFFLGYQPHRTAAPLTEALGWAWKFAVSGRHEKHAERTIARLSGTKYFLLPLQLSGDYQIRAHSPFADMPGATTYVLESFAAHAPADVHLLIKAHPLDASFFPWRGFIAERARRLGISERVHFIDGVNLEELAAQSHGMVCVNSTSATLALQADLPVCAIGDAIYKVPGLTFAGHLDAFWTDPPRPDAGLYDAFRRTLLEQCLVRGGLASESAVSTLIDSLLDRLVPDLQVQSVPSQVSTLAK
jgi:capsular polysaccharide export protein